MSNNPPIMAIALLKERSYLNGYNRKKLSTFSQNKPKNRLQAMLATHLLKTMDDLYNYSYLMTNPSFMTALELGDKVLVLGSLHLTKREKKPVFMKKELKFIPKIRVYLNKNSIDKQNLKKEEERKGIVKFFKERKKIWNFHERRKDFKENLCNLLNEANKMIRFTLENYRNVFDENEEDQ